MRWGVRLEYPLEASGFIEVATAEFLGLELGTGVMARARNGVPFEITPYSVVGFYRKRYWCTLEAKIPVSALRQSVGFGAAVACGGRF